MTEVPKIIYDLVERFERDIDYYKSSGYKEEQLKNEFLNPFFEALGWDVYNKRGFAPQYRDVIFEDSIKMAGGVRAPDYCFTLAGKRKFFVEAKKPSVNIKMEFPPSFQLRRYAWTAKLPLSILTDFEEFAIYESRKRPSKDDKVNTERVLYLTFRDYIERWDEISNIFSRDAVYKGFFDKYIESTKKKRGTQEVDDEFLNEIEYWRDLLAKNIAIQNPKLSVRELNYAIQQTIDRIIFLRMCEDRGIESYGQLRDLIVMNNAYEKLCEIYIKADEKYNSGLFHFRDEKYRNTLPDELTLNINIDNKVLIEIIKNLYYPDSPYEFSVLSPEILGNVYERFLGKIVRLTEGHRAKVEEKPEVKKAGGVYYTPQYIVDFIVENTVGKLCRGKTPNQISKIRILDPACGSGSFLLGAYKYLLNYHLKYYTEQKNLKRIKNQIYQGRDGEWFLTIKEKKRILINNIYGVDKDPQAVEVTKLSLLLKVLEGEKRDVFEKQQKLLKERALPDLGYNIKCGNSLIGPDFYKNIQTKLFDNEDMYRLNVFDWKEEFEEIIKNGGFNIIIGNPPYLRIQGLQEYYGDQIDYFIENYTSAVKRFDLSLLFTEKGFQLLQNDGYLGFILPHKFLHSDYGSGLRNYLIKESAIDTFINFRNNLVFKNASTYTGILILIKNERTLFNYYEFGDMINNELSVNLFKIKKKDFVKYDLKKLSEEPWVLTNKENYFVLKKLLLQKNKLQDIFNDIVVGVQSGIDNIHILKLINNPHTGIIKVYSEKANENVIIEEGLLKPLLMGDNVQRYSQPKFTHYCIYPYFQINGKTKILEEENLKKKYPLGYNYLLKYRTGLREIRIKQKTNPKYWYSCHRSRDIGIFSKRRIITPEISLKGNMTICDGDIYNNTQVYSLIPSNNRKEKLEYWLGILNSNIMWWFLSNTGTVLRGGYFRFKTSYLKPFPIRTINFENLEDKSLHDNIVKLVEKMLALYKEIEKVKTSTENQLIQRQIDAIDKQINQLVYNLYGLSEKEISIIEK